MSEQNLTTIRIGEVARRLGLGESFTNYQYLRRLAKRLGIEPGRVPWTHRHGARVFTEADVEKMRAALAARCQPQNSKPS